MNIWKLFSRFFKRTFGDSSIHGFGYIVKSELHFLEKMFWIATLIFSSIAAYLVFHGQYVRFKESPTVLSIQLMPNGEFPRPALTICPKYSEKRTNEEFDKKWMMKYGNKPMPKNIKELYMVIHSTNYTNLEPFRQFVDFKESLVDNINLLEVANMSFPLMSESAVSSSDFYRRVITEVGICFTTNQIIGPQDLQPNKKWDTREGCMSNTLCMEVTSYKDEGTEAYRIYFHSPHEVLSGDNKNFDELSRIGDTKTKTSYLRRLKYERIVSETNVRNFSPASRRCRFFDELENDFYQNYTSNLCKISCRIRNALQKCHCVPYFYNMKNSLKYPTCNVTGMVCLADNPSWTNASSIAPCKCLDTCESIIIRSIERRVSADNFDTKVEYMIILPRIIIKREVLFDYIDLIVSLGGSLALFLGFIFLSGVELIFFVLEFVIEVVIALVEHIVWRRSGRVHPL